MLFVLYCFLLFLQSRNTAVQVQIDSYFRMWCFGCFLLLISFIRSALIFRSHCMDYAWVIKDVSAFQSRIYSMFALSVDDRFHVLYCPVPLNGSLSAPALFRFLNQIPASSVSLCFSLPKWPRRGQSLSCTASFLVITLSPIGRFRVLLPWCISLESLMWNCLSTGSAQL